MKPFFVRTAGTSVEVWSGYHIQFDGEERHDWQKVLKAQLKELLSQFAIPVGAPLAGYYDTTDPRIADTENSLFTNWLTSMPAGISTLRFEHGTAAPPAPPISIDLLGGHLHYYRYEVSRRWAKWEPDETLACWNRVPRRLPDEQNARPIWFALRDANAKKLITISAGRRLDPNTNFGIRLIVHANTRGPRNVVTYSEKLVDGSISAFHNDRYSDQLFTALAPKFPGVAKEELRHALDHPAGPLFDSRAIHTTPGGIQISPSDERCRLGEVTIRQDSTTQWPELSGELFTVRPIDPPE